MGYQNLPKHISLTTVSPSSFSFSLFYFLPANITRHNAGRPPPTLSDKELRTKPQKSFLHLRARFQKSMEA